MVQGSKPKPGAELGALLATSRCGREAEASEVLSPFSAKEANLSVAEQYLVRRGDVTDIGVMHAGEAGLGRNG